ncbi:nucleotide sugar dehydrogenase [Sinosporangium siamense]|uniref:UDP-N-acetyl-D-mannosaminuronic acid dehydrogenase n=1 Tax=Sinosporangium siamense TaxID=1367973 RepID=A0A919RB41_9ACTN|nr:nucleotide sugar dehydrogenase [Sinosporangium siamense]GII90670.1 UDP-N-acetyl-D-mannosaminuronic acid dehydrogenase [Sinosporangium siamense]
MRFLPDAEELTAAVVGLGYVGSCVAAVLAESGMNVIGVDTDHTLIDELEAGHCRFSEAGLPELIAGNLAAGRLRVTTDYEGVSGADVVVVAVGTPAGDRGVLVETQIRAACDELSKHIRAGQLVIVKSTMPPGRTRDLVIPLLEGGGLVCGRDFGLATCPERLSEGVALSELRTFPIVVGGWCEDSGTAAAAFWRRAVGVEVIVVGSLEAAEMVKLADNWWIDHNIALANELAKVCALFEVDVLNVIAAANTIAKGSGNVNILLPSVGVGGSCLTKDPWMVWRTAHERNVDLHTIPAAREVNDSMPHYTAGLIVDELAKLGKKPGEAKVAVLGLAFKNNTGDLRATPTLPVVTALREAGAEVAVFDPLVNADEAEKTFGMRMAASLDEAVSGADCLAVLALHREFEAVDLAALKERVAPSCAVVDGRAYYPRKTIDRLRELGFAYRGIGR